jgi:dsDNA-binding SOS-regulon protein
MKRKALKPILLLVLLVVFSCDEPETRVTNTVHPDGSVTRKIEMRNKKNEFNLSDLQVPFDSTWIIKDSIEIGQKKDTTWIRTAEKFFRNVDEINISYLTDSGANKDIQRKAKFAKKFKWFNTEYRFSELIDRKMSNGYPIKDFLNAEEFTYFYSPDGLKQEKKNSADSLKFRALEDTISKKVEIWTTKSLVSEWIVEFSRLIEGRAGNEITGESMKANMDKYIKMLDIYDNKFDSLWEAGIILKDMIGEKNSIRFKPEADSAMAFLEKILVVNFKDYSVRIVMPGKVIGTNGFIDKTEVLLWPVKSDYFLTEQYEMWAESKVINIWAWAVTGVFILFVIIGLIIKSFNKRV